MGDDDIRTFSALVTGDDIDLEHSAAGVVVANDAEIDDESAAGLVVGRKVELEDGSRVLFTVGSPMLVAAVAAVAGGIIALAWWLLTGGYTGHGSLLTRMRRRARLRSVRRRVDKGLDDVRARARSLV